MAKHNPKIQMTELCSPQKHIHLRTSTRQAPVISATTGNDVANHIDGADKEFDPPAEMMVNDFDDERTLDEEEALEGSEDPQVELNSLQKEGDMPLDELLAMYGYSGDGTSENVKSSGSEVSNHDSIMEADEIGPEVEECIVKRSPTELEQLYNMPEKGAEENPGTSRLLRLSRPQSEEEEEDYDYSPDEEDWGKTIMVGSDYQAGIPEGLCKYDDALPYENEDKLLWNPISMTEDIVEKFLIKAQEPLVNNAQGINTIPTGIHTRDDEQALYLLLQCGFNFDEALRRRRMNVVPPADTMSLWSEEECRNFENGLRTYGKDFHMIHQNKVRTRSVGELVQFYYLWKKTERHDIFANKAKLEKKKYTLHPGITDYMDRFLEEQDSGGGVANRDRSSSPNVQCLIYCDPKRHRSSESAAADISVAASRTSPQEDSTAGAANPLDKDVVESKVNITAGAAGSASSDKAPLNNVEVAFASAGVSATVLLPGSGNSELGHATEPVAL